MPGPIRSRMPRVVPVARNSQPISTEMALNAPPNVREGSQNYGGTPQQAWSYRETSAGGRSPVSGRPAHHGPGAAQRRRPEPPRRLRLLRAKRPGESWDQEFG